VKEIPGAWTATVFEAAEGQLMMMMKPELGRGWCLSSRVFDHEMTPGQSEITVVTILLLLLRDVASGTNVSVVHHQSCIRGTSPMGRHGGISKDKPAGGVLRVDLAGDPTVAELLAQVRARSLAAHEHQDVPFEVLVDRLNPTRSLTHHPLGRRS
jgi:hypothetical protein